MTKALTGIKTQAESNKNFCCSVLGYPIKYITQN